MQGGALADGRAGPDHAHKLRWISTCTKVLQRPIFLEKNSRETRHVPHYPYIFHSSLKKMPKVNSRGLDHSAKDFFMWFFMWFLKNMWLFLNTQDDFVYS